MHTSPVIAAYLNRGGGIDPERLRQLALRLNIARARDSGPLPGGRPAIDPGFGRASPPGNIDPGFERAPPPGSAGIDPGFARRPDFGPFGPAVPRATPGEDPIETIRGRLSSPQYEAFPQRLPGRNPAEEMAKLRDNYTGNPARPIPSMVRTAAEPAPDLETSPRSILAGRDPLLNVAPLSDPAGPPKAPGQDLAAERAQALASAEREQAAGQPRLDALNAAAAEAGPQKKMGLLDRFLMGVGAKALPAEMPSEQKANILRNRASIAEGFGRMGAGFAARSGHRAEPYFAEHTREEIGREEDRITPEESRFYASQGFRVPAGVSRSMVQRALPSFVSAAWHRSAAASRDENAADRLKLAKEALDDRQSRYDETAGRKIRENVNRERGDWLKPGSRIGKLKDALIASEQVKALANQNNPVATRAAMVMVAKRLGGDTGVLTQQDIEAYEGKIGIPGFFRSVQKTFTGDFTPEQKRMLLETAAELARTAREEYDREREARVSSFSVTHGPDLERAGIDEASLRAMLGAEGGGGGATMDIPGGGTMPAKKIRIPRSDTEAIREAEEDGIPYEVY